jgi:hypothetical protein
VTINGTILKKERKKGKKRKAQRISVFHKGVFNSEKSREDKGGKSI